jgi:hypothetical protein
MQSNSAWRNLVRVTSKRREDEKLRLFETLAHYPLRETELKVNVFIWIGRNPLKSPESKNKR